MALLLNCMVEYTHILNTAYSSLSDPTRRDILLRVTKRELSISDIAQPYNMSFAAVAKHISVLEAAHLVHKRQVGRQHLVQASLDTITLLQSHLQSYEQLWNQRFTALDKLLKSNQ